jgi:PPM family protein phosphatase
MSSRKKDHVPRYIRNEQGEPMAVTDESVIELPGLSVHLRSSARTDVGAVRTVNEDTFVVHPPLYLVADGMGGHAKGDLASQTAAQVFTTGVGERTPSSPEHILDTIRDANKAVRGLSGADATGVGVSGTTLAGMALVDAGDGVNCEWMLFNIGDSRIYEWNGQDLVQLSVDHSAVQELVNAGVITEEEAVRHPDRNVITRAMGADENVHADTWFIPALGHHVFLLCSDGVSKELSNEDMVSLLAEYGGQDDIADRLVNRAVEHGGHDNATVIVVEADVDPLFTVR